METTSEETTTEELSFEKEETHDYVSQEEARKIEWDSADSPIGLFQNFEHVFYQRDPRWIFSKHAGKKVFCSYCGF